MTSALGVFSICAVLAAAARPSVAEEFSCDLKEAEAAVRLAVDQAAERLGEVRGNPQEIVPLMLLLPYAAEPLPPLDGAGVKAARRVLRAKWKFWGNCRKTLAARTASVEGALNEALYKVYKKQGLSSEADFGDMVAAAARASANLSIRRMARAVELIREDIKSDGEHLRGLEPDSWSPRESPAALASRKVRLFEALCRVSLPAPRPDSEERELYFLHP